jgi:hypothetical protein
MTRRVAVLLSALLPFSGLTSAFQGGGKRVSPHETVSVDLGGKTIQISYGRPSLKGRDIRTLAPYGKVWRLGADEATKITVSARTTIGGTLVLAPGSYSLFAIPGPDKWTLIVNKVAQQWGAFSYKEEDDLGRIDLPVQHLSSPVEQFTIELKKQTSDTAELVMSWGKESVRTALKVG